MMRKFYNSITRSSEWAAKAVSWIVALLIISICYDVFARYLFNAPTIWSYALSYMMGGTLSALGLAYVYSVGGNVRVDVIYNKFSPKLKLILDLFFTIAFFFPLYGFLAYFFGVNTWHAFVVKEYDINSIWYPVIWPFMTAITLGFVFLFVQGIATFIRDVRTLLKGGKEPW
jgi:TRAP-type mannitol/chloroaromatic compound transport system permease small subunit